MGFAIETHALTKMYGPRAALRGIDPSVESGFVFGVIGPNGAGKTTTMRLLLDIIRPSRGSVLVLGQPPRSGGPALRTRIGFLPGELRLEGRITGHTLLRHFAAISGPVRPGIVDELAERLGLDLSRQVRALSRGNKQKLGIIQAFMHAPPLLVLDEPTSGLDPIVQQEFLGMVHEARDAGATVFLSSHVLSEIQQAADTVAILRSGRVVTVSSVESLRQSAVRHVRVGFASLSPRAAAASLAAIDGVAGVADAALSTDGAATAAASTPPQPVTTTSSAVVTATITGPIDAFVKAIAHHTITELTVEEPDLEESVLRLYSAPDDEGNPESRAPGSLTRARHSTSDRHRP